MPKQLIVLCDGTDESPQTDVGGIQDNVQLLRTKLAENLPGKANIAYNYKQGWQVDTSTYENTQRYVYYDRGLGAPLLNKSGKEISTNLNSANLLIDALRLYEDYSRAEANLVADGITQNVIQAYTFLVNYYTPGDQIYLFGFSRGAYTLRLLISAINYIGLIDKSKYATSAELNAAINNGFELYNSPQPLTDPNNPINAFRTTNSVPLDNIIQFYGAWDCVPGPEEQKFYEQEVLSDIVVTARHALAIDESRPPYKPQIWTASGNTDSLQCWFPGSHMDVGGGEENHDLANVTFQWMVGEAIKAGLYVVPSNLTTADLAPDPLAPQHDTGANDIIPNIPITWDDVFTPELRQINITATQVLSSAATERYGQEVTTIAGTKSTVGLYEPANLQPILSAYKNQTNKAPSLAESGSLYKKTTHSA